MASLKGKIKAKSAKIIIFNAASLAAEKEKIGLTAARRRFCDHLSLNAKSVVKKYSVRCRSL